MCLLGRLLVVAFGLLLAIPAGGTLLIAVLVLDPAAEGWLAAGALTGLDAGLSDLAAGLPPEGILLLIAGLARAGFVLLVVPPVLTAVAGETLRLRSLVWYGGACGIVTAALPWLARGAVRPGGAASAAEARVTVILFVAGAGAGLVYWIVAGRRVGRDEAISRA